MKNNIQKTLAAGLAGMLLASSIAGCGTASGSSAADTSAADISAVDDYTAEVGLVTEAAKSLLPSHSDTEGKEETVYVVADAQGKPTETIVSAWLKNPDGADTLEDVSDLTDIVNVKGNETYTRSADSHLTWAADGRDIHYQGTTARELPVTTSISYELDGKNTSPQELAGASGHLTITFQYQNNTASDRVVNGKNVTLYQPFLVISGLVLDGNTASHISVTNGKIVSTGDRSIVIGMAMPGLRESLGLDTMETGDGVPVDIDLPETVVIDADVQDFELLTTLTVISNDLLQDVDLEDAGTIDDLKGAMDKLTDASTRLADGTDDLYNGAGALSDGTQDLINGIDQLDDGAGAVRSGASDLAAGSAALNGGAQQISGNMTALSDGLASARNGADDLDSGLARMQTSVADLPAGVDALYQGTQLVSGALKNDSGPSLYAGAKAIESGAGAVSAGLTGTDGSILTAANGIASGAQQLAAGADNISAEAASLQDDLSAALSMMNGYAQTLSALGIDTSTYIAKANAAYKELEQIRCGADSISAGLTGDGASICSAANGIAGGAQQLDAGVSQISAGAQSMEAGIDTIVSDDNLGAVTAGLAELSKNSEALVNGMDQLAQGASLLADGMDASATGAAQLADGSARLAESSGTLSAGASALSDGVSRLSDGTSQLRTGGTALSDGMAQLLEGAKDLRNGMAEFDKEGIRALSGLVEDDARELIDRLKAVQELSREYTSFDGGDCGTPGTVQFIVRTESIKKS